MTKDEPRVLWCPYSSKWGSLNSWQTLTAFWVLFKSSDMIQDLEFSLFFGLFILDESTFITFSAFNLLNGIDTIRLLAFFRVGICLASCFICLFFLIAFDLLLSEWSPPGVIFLDFKIPEICYFTVEDSLRIYLF